MQALKIRNDITSTVRWYMSQGMTVTEALVEIERVLRTKIPEHIVALVREELRFDG